MRSNRLADSLAVIARHGLFATAQGVNHCDLGMIVRKIIICPRNEQQPQLVCAGERAEGRLRHVGAGHFQILRFEGRLGIDGIIVMAQAVIFENPLLSILNKAVIDHHVLLPAIIPVLQIFQRNTAHDGKPAASLLGRQVIYVHLSLQGRQLIHIRPHFQVIIRLYALAAGPGAAHNGAESVNRYVFMKLMQVFHLFQPFDEGFHVEIMLPRIDETAIYQRINR